MHPARTEQSGQGREHLLSLKGLLAGILILLSVLILLTLWGIVSSKEEQTPSSEPSSEAASSEEMKPQNLVPNFVGIDYEQIKNNREYTSMYLFRAVLEYSDTVPSGQIIRDIEQPGACGQLLYGGERWFLRYGLCGLCQRGRGRHGHGGYGDHHIYRRRPQCADHRHPGRACRYRAYHSGNAPGGRHRAGIRYRLNNKSRSGSLATGSRFCLFRIGKRMAN